LSQVSERCSEFCRLYRKEYLNSPVDIFDGSRTSARYIDITCVFRYEILLDECLNYLSLSIGSIFAKKSVTILIIEVASNSPSLSDVLCAWRDPQSWRTVYEV
jgi:hypothetical protein